MRNQIVSQDELREEGGSPTHALFALEMLLCRGGWGDCYVHHESTLRLFFCMFYDLAAGDPLAHREERGRRYGLLLMFGNLGELLLERHTAHIKMKYLWSDIQYAIVLLFMNWTELVGQALREQARTAQQDCWWIWTQVTADSTIFKTGSSQNFNLSFLLQPFCFYFCIGLNWKAKSHFQEARKVAEVVEQEVSQHLIDQQKANEAAARIPHSEPSKDLKKSLNLDRIVSWNWRTWQSRLARCFLQYFPMKEGYIYIYIYQENHVQMVDMWFSQAEAPGSRCEEPSWGEDALKT